MLTSVHGLPLPTGTNGNGNGAAVNVAHLSTKTLHVRGDSDGTFQLQLSVVDAADAVSADFFNAGAAITNKGFVTVTDLAKSARIVVSGQGAGKTPHADLAGLYATEGG
jgi:hypothetical protein